MDKKVVKAKEIGRRFTGFSILSLGVQWQYTVSEREIVREFILFLEDRRALYVPTQVEIEADVRWSAQSIREHATKALAQLAEGSKVAGPIRLIRAACRRYLEHSQQYPNIAALDAAAGNAAPWLISLGELRAAVGYNIGTLAVALDLDIEEELASIIPAEDLEA